MSEFLIKSAISMAVLLLVYRLFLEREKMHRFNRFYLLFSLIFSLAIPFINITVFIEETQAPTQVIQQVTETLTTMPVMKTSATEFVANEPKVDYLPYLLWSIYSLITSILTVRFALNIAQFYKRKKRNEKVSYNGATIVLLDEDILPHTFLNNIFLNKEEYKSQTIEPELYNHELIHVKQRHTLDILFIELLKTVFWFNPLLYFYKKAIQLNHEYLADEKVIEANNLAYYQQLLLNKASFKATPISLSSNLNFSITKKRFNMMNKTTPKLRVALLQIGTLPLITLLTFIFSAKTSAQESQLSPEAEVKLEKFRATDSEVEQIKKNNPDTFSDDPEVAFKNTDFTFIDEQGHTIYKKGYENLNEEEKELVKLSPVKGAAKLEFTEEQITSNP